MKIFKEVFPDSELESLDLEHICGAPLQVPLTKSSFKERFINEERDTYLLMLGGLGPALPGWCMFFGYKNYKVKFHCEELVTKRDDKYLLTFQVDRSNLVVFSDRENGIEGSRTLGSELISKLREILLAYGESPQYIVEVKF